MATGLADEPVNPEVSELAEDPERAAYVAVHQGDNAKASALAALALVKEIKGLRRDLKGQRTPPTMTERKP